MKSLIIRWISYQAFEHRSEKISSHGFLGTFLVLERRAMKLMSQSLNLQSQITLNLRLVDYGVGCGTVFVTYFSMVISATADVSDE